MGKPLEHTHVSLFKWRTNFRVLVVDDNVAAADALTKLLNRVGMQAECVYDGMSALERDTDEYDVILLDIGMPEMDGHEVARAFRARGATLPIVALTGFGLSEDRERAMRSGFSAHLIKPASLKDIQELMCSLPAHQ